MHPHIPRPRRKATRTCTGTAGVVPTVHAELMWPFTARVNEKTAPIERIAALLFGVRVMSALPPKADVGPQSRNVRFVRKADLSSHSKKVHYSIISSQRYDANEPSRSIDSRVVS